MLCEHNHAQWAETPLSAPQSAPQMSSFRSGCKEDAPAIANLKVHQQKLANVFQPYEMLVISGVGVFCKIFWRSSLCCGLWMPAAWKAEQAWKAFSYVSEICVGRASALHLQLGSYRLRVLKLHKKVENESVLQCLLQGTWRVQKS